MACFLAQASAGSPETWIVVSSLAAAFVAIVLAVRANARAAADREAAERRTAGERARAEALEADLRALRERTEVSARGEHPALEALPRGLRDVASASSRDDLVVQVARVVERVLAPRQWMVFTAADEAGTEFVVAASGAEDGSAWPPGARISSQTGRVGLAVRRREAIDTYDIENEPPIVREQIAATEPKSFVVDLVVPVVVGDQVVAVAAAGGLRQAPGVARAALQAVAEHAAVVLRGLEARERAQRFAHQDSLTGLGNRTWFGTTGAETLFRVRNERGRLALLVFRIRDLDVYVRRNGHATGDRLVRAVASVLRPVCRQGDLLARWGEGEFAAMLLGIDEAMATDIAERVKATIAGVEWPHASEQPGGRLVVESGVALHPGDGESLEDLLDAATSRLGRPAGDALSEDSEEYLDADAASR